MSNSFGIPGRIASFFIQEADIILKHVNNRYVEEGTGQNFKVEKDLNFFASN